MNIQWNAIPRAGSLLEPVWRTRAAELELDPVGCSPGMVQARWSRRELSWV